MADDMRAVGLMSGTSADGVDAALVATDGVRRVAVGASLTIPYERSLRRALRSPDLSTKAAIRETEEAMTDVHAEAVALLCSNAGLKPAEIDVLGFHGHTVLHAPHRRRTWQIGDGRRLARATGIDVVAQFRTADVVAGGQGAPLAPIYHAALARDLERPLAVLNVGGVANVTWLGAARDGGEDDMRAFDTGPGNALLDDWAGRHTGEPLDVDGRLSARGRAVDELIGKLLDDPYFAKVPPKSLDRDHFAMRAAAALDDLSPADGAATLLTFTAASVARARRHLPAPPRRWLVCGGGRHNPQLMAALAARLGAPVAPVEAVGWHGDALEAQAFGYLAVRSLLGLPITFPATTGVAEPMTGGRLFRAR